MRSHEALIVLARHHFLVGHNVRVHQESRFREPAGSLLAQEIWVLRTPVLCDVDLHLRNGGVVPNPTEITFRRDAHQNAVVGMAAACQLIEQSATLPQFGNDRCFVYRCDEILVHRRLRCDIITTVSAGSNMVDEQLPSMEVASRRVWVQRA